MVNQEENSIIHAWLNVVNLISRKPLAFIKSPFYAHYAQDFIFSDLRNYIISVISFIFTHIQFTIVKLKLSIAIISMKLNFIIIYNVKINIIKSKILKFFFYSRSYAFSDKDFHKKN